MTRHRYSELTAATGFLQITSNISNGEEALFKSINEQTISLPILPFQLGCPEIHLTLSTGFLGNQLEPKN